MCDLSLQCISEEAPEELNVYGVYCINKNCHDALGLQGSGKALNRAFLEGQTSLVAWKTSRDSNPKVSNGQNLLSSHLQLAVIPIRSLYSMSRPVIHQVIHS